MNTIPIEAFIYLLKITYGKYKEMSGGCYKFHLILRMIYGEDNAIGYYNGDHIITKVGGQFYDVNGTIKGDISGNYVRIGFGCDYTYKQMNKIFKKHLIKDDVFID